MKTLSKLALLAALAGSVSAMAVVPAQAKDKKDAAAAPGFKLSKPVQALAAPVQTAIKAGDVATAEPQLVQLETAATTDDDKYIAAALRYDLENAKLKAARAANPNARVDQTSLAKPLDALIAAKSTPANLRGEFLFQRGQLAAIGGQSAIAADYFNRAQQAGYSSPDLALQIAQSRIQGGDVAGGLTALDAEVTRRETAGEKVPETFYTYGISQANKAKMTPQTLAWLRKYVAAYPNPTTWYKVVLTYGLQQNSIIKPTKPQEVDLLRLLRAANALADQSLYELYAERTYDAGNPYETQAVLKEGVAAGKIQATVPYIKGMLADSATAIRNDGPLATSERQANTAKDGKVASQTGDAYLGQGNYAKAVEMYRLALTKGNVNADDVNTHLGIALARSGDKAGATTAFGLVKAEPQAGIAGLWTTYLQVGATGPAATAAAAAG